MTRAERWAVARWELRLYVRHGLYAEQQVPALRLPRLDGAAVTEEDVYASRPGSGDPRRLDDDGNPRWRTALGQGPHSDDPTGTAAGSASGWRAYANREVGEGPTELTFERETVAEQVKRIGTRGYLAIYDLGHRSAKQAARERQESPATVRRATNDALDALLERLYRIAAPSRLAS